jgi:hypothetical protein
MEESPLVFGHICARPLRPKSAFISWTGEQNSLIHRTIILATWITSSKYIDLLDENAFPR